MSEREVFLWELGNGDFSFFVSNASFIILVKSKVHLLKIHFIIMINVPFENG